MSDLRDAPVLGVAGLEAVAFCFVAASEGGGATDPALKTPGALAD
ncbi:hypothetical protein [Microvirga flavescens]|nr:hypothetical protein [Microvirga flavescens]